MAESVENLLKIHTWRKDITNKQWMLENHMNSKNIQDNLSLILLIIENYSQSCMEVNNSFDAKNSCVLINYHYLVEIIDKYFWNTIEIDVNFNTLSLELSLRFLEYFKSKVNYSNFTMDFIISTIFLSINQTLTHHKLEIFCQIIAFSLFYSVNFVVESFAKFILFNKKINPLITTSVCKFIIEDSLIIPNYSANIFKLPSCSLTLGLLVIEYYINFLISSIEEFLFHQMIKNDEYLKKITLIIIEWIYYLPNIPFDQFYASTLRIDTTSGLLSKDMIQFNWLFKSFVHLNLLITKFNHWFDETGVKYGDKLNYILTKGLDQKVYSSKQQQSEQIDDVELGELSDEIQTYNCFIKRVDWIDLILVSKELDLIYTESNNEHLNKIISFAIMTLNIINNDFDKSFLVKIINEHYKNQNLENNNLYFKILLSL